MKHEWKKNEKQFYLPKNKPELISIPKFKYFTIDGSGNPNDDFFEEQEKFSRKSKTHREIYLSDARKVSADKLKTVLRFNVEKNNII